MSNSWSTFVTILLTFLKFSHGKWILLGRTRRWNDRVHHYDDVIMSAMASQITSLTFVYSSAYSGADQRKHQSSASLAFVRGIHRWPVNSPHKGPETWKMFPFNDVIMRDPIFVIAGLAIHSCAICIYAAQAHTMATPLQTSPRRDGRVVNRTQGCGLHVTLRPGVRIPVLPRVIGGVALSRRLSSGGWLQST